jgi:hypothetical protein
MGTSEPGAGAGAGAGGKKKKAKKRRVDELLVEQGLAHDAKVARVSVLKLAAEMCVDPRSQEQCVCGRSCFRLCVHPETCARTLRLPVLCARVYT